MSLAMWWGFALCGLSLALAASLATPISNTNPASSPLSSTSTTAPSNALLDGLQAVRFLHEGVVKSGEQYSFHPFDCGYLEGENVSCSQCSWSGPCSYLFDAPQGTRDCSPAPPQDGFDRPGSDLTTVVLPQDSWELCRAACCDNPACAGWVYVPSAPAQFINCNQGDHCCYFKSADVTPTKSNDTGITTGAISRPDPPLRDPPLGMRSAVPLGGLGAGALELRADGTFHEVTIHNQHPASSAKYGVLEEAVLGLVLQPEGQDKDARVLRTNPPSFGKGVDSIAYSGAHPVSRLRIVDDNLPAAATVFAYSTLKPADIYYSATPAVAFTLVVENPSNVPVQAGFFFSLPMAAVKHCFRNSKSTAATTSPAVDHVQCLGMCAQAGSTKCSSWTFNGTHCTVQPDVPHSEFRLGFYCGVAGTWEAKSNVLTLHATPPLAVDSAAAGNVTLSGSAAGGAGANLFFAVANSTSSLFESFSAGSGSFAPTPGVLTGPFASALAAYGAASSTITVPAEGTATLSLVFTWYFPERDHMGVNVGNYYEHLGTSSEDFAVNLAQPDKLAEVVGNINMHHAVFSNANTSYPLWLQDHMINQMSHFRGMMFLRDGRMREYEAPDCPDVDSIHNDYQRHLPYFWLMPAFELSKLARWGDGQAKDGHIWEDLGSFGLGPLDQWADRIMGDTTSLWVMEQWEYFTNTNNTEYLAANYPTITRALGWMIKNANTYNQGLPYRLVCTYDIIAFDQYNATTFNSFIYLATLRAGEEMANVMGDQATTTLVRQAFTYGQSQLYALLWNSTHNYFRAYTGGNAIMGDCLYGQMLALHNNLGWLADQDKIKAHLSAELQFNGDPFGIKVVTGRHQPPPVAGANDASFPSRERVQTARAAFSPMAHTLQEQLAAIPALSAGLTIPSSFLSPGNSSRRVQQVLANMIDLHARTGFDTQDDVIWLGAAPDWSYLQLAMDPQGDLDAALAPTKAQLSNYRDRLRDLWNIVGITSPGDWGTDPHVQGMPYVTSHYGFVMTDYYLLPRLSGQVTNLPKGSLSFSPRYACPFNLPLLLANTTGTVSCTDSVFTVTLAFGSLSLPANGLVVGGRTYPHPLQLVGGQSVSW